MTPTYFKSKNSCTDNTIKTYLSVHPKVNESVPSGFALLWWKVDYLYIAIERYKYVSSQFFKEVLIQFCFIQ